MEVVDLLSRYPMNNSHPDNKFHSNQTVRLGAFLFLIQPFLPSQDEDPTVVVRCPTESSLQLPNNEKERICSWVSTRRSLQLVSGDDGDRLTISILNRWLKMSAASFVVLRSPQNVPVAFCTLSRSELPGIPEPYIEICHLVVDPTYRRLSIGSHIVKAAVEFAAHSGYSYVCGRVVRSNSFAIRLANYLHAENITKSEDWLLPDCIWFRFTCLTHAQ